MRIPPYWARQTHREAGPDGKERAYDAWGWSFASMDAARTDAADRARRVFEKLTTHREPESYEYLEHPLREEIVDAMGAGPHPFAAITRNRYGSLVLNCASVCFVDVDFPRPAAQGFVDAIMGLFSKAKKRQQQQAVQEATLGRVLDWAQRNPQHSFRLYRTCAGLRLLMTDQLYEPTSEQTSGLLSDLGSDTLYRKLTEKQECFRARLTAKPWRCGCTRPPNRYPWGDDDARQAYRKWQANYETRSARYGTCRLLETIGGGPANEQIAAIVKLHDQHACADDGVELA